MSGLVLDAWAVMAWLKGQSSAARVRGIAGCGGQSWKRKFLYEYDVNLGEVFYLSVKARGSWHMANGFLPVSWSRITIMPASDDFVMQAARLKARYAISYADAFAAATAINRELALVTGGPELRALATQEDKLKLEWIVARRPRLKKQRFRGTISVTQASDHHAATQHVRH